MSPIDAIRNAGNAIFLKTLESKLNADSNNKIGSNINSTRPGVSLNDDSNSRFKGASNNPANTSNTGNGINFNFFAKRNSMLAKSSIALKARTISR